MQAAAGTRSPDTSDTKTRHWFAIVGHQTVTHDSAILASHVLCSRCSHVDDIGDQVTRLDRTEVELNSNLSGAANNLLVA